MKTYLYFSLMPEALIGSMLPPEKFAIYRAIGAEETSHGPDIFFEIEGLTADNSPFPVDEIDNVCVPHPDGSPKKSAYLAIYRVLEMLPVETLRKMYLVTRDGRALGIGPAKDLPQFKNTFYLYQQMWPAHPQIASTLNPEAYCRYMTFENEKLHLPKICFFDIRLGELADEPEKADVFNLPYKGIEHLRNCLQELQTDRKKKTKTVERTHPQSFPFRAIKNGAFIGNCEKLLFFPFPTKEELQSTYFQWWRSATLW